MKSKSNRDYRPFTGEEKRKWMLSSAVRERERIKAELERVDELPEGYRKTWLLSVGDNFRDGEPLFAQIRERYAPLESPDELRFAGIRYDDAIPILLHWLPRIGNLSIKASIGAALAVPYAGPAAAALLAIEMRRVIAEHPPSPKRDFDVASMALGFVGSGGLELRSEALDLVKDVNIPSQARITIAESFAKARDKRYDGVLAELLADSDTALVLSVLNIMKRSYRRFGTAAMRAHIAPLRLHPSEEVRQAAEKTLRAISEK